MYDPLDKVELKLDLRRSSIIRVEELVIHIEVENNRLSFEVRNFLFKIIYNLIIFIFHSKHICIYIYSNCK